MDRMKILQILQKPQLRGAEIFAAQLAQKLSENGHQVALLFLFSGQDLLPYKGLKIHLHANPKHRMLDFVAWRRLAKIIQDFQPDIVQANAGDTLKYAGLSRMFFGWKGKLIFRNANLISDFIDSTPKKKYNQLLLSQVDGVASVSKICREDFVSLFKWKKPIAELPIGVWVPHGVSKLPREIAEILDSRPFLIHIGSFVSEKNHEGLLRIFERIRNKSQDIKLLLFGDGPLRSKIEKQLPPNVFSLGPRNDIHAILPHAKALLLPSLIEGLPAVILEAMATKVPVVAYNVGGISEVIQDRKTGFLIPKGEEETFFRIVVEEVLNHDFDQTALLNNAVDLVEKNYSLDVIGKKFSDFYISLSNSSHANSDT